MFHTIREIKNAMKIHGGFLQKKNRDSKIETFEITNIYREGIDLKIIIELDNGRSGYFDVYQIYKNFEFLDETSFSNVKVYGDVQIHRIS